MNEQPLMTPPENDLEMTVQETARHFTYPPTPDIAGKLRQRRERNLRPSARIWRVAAAALLALVVVTITVPQVRAFVLEIIRIGAVRIFLIEPTPTISGRATITPAAPVLKSVLDMPGETTLATAQAAMNKQIWLPQYPSDLGAPEHVYLQDHGAVLVTLVWTVPGAPDGLRLSLEVMDNNTAARKLYPIDGQRQAVQVNGGSAEWLTDVHEVWYYGGDIELGRLVTKPVLIWQEADTLLTYRLEADLTVDEAIKVAESLAAP